MPASSLLALIDDISALLDDVATLTKVAATKTSAVMGDDLALNAKQVSGVRVDRELPVVWAVAKGSLVNKLILVPAALVISAVLPAAIQPLMMVGGLYLCFEGFEKVLHSWQHWRSGKGGKGSEAATPDHADRLSALADTKVDIVAVEREKVKGAIRTDFILSAEIIVITLGTMSAAALGEQVLALSIVAVGATAAVYGLVAGIVKLDDLGVALHDRESAVAQRTGLMILRAAPIMMKALSVLGTVAMFTVGGGIVGHGVPPVGHLLESIAAALGGSSSAMEAVAGAVADGLFGVLAGAVPVGMVALFARFRSSGKSH